MVAGHKRDNSISRLFALVLPFTAGALLNALEGLCSQPGLPALALIGLALLQPCVFSLGKRQCRVSAESLLCCRSSHIMDLQLLPSARWSSNEPCHYGIVARYMYVPSNRHACRHEAFDTSYVCA